MVCWSMVDSVDVGATACRSEAVVLWVAWSISVACGHDGILPRAQVTLATSCFAGLSNLQWMPIDRVRGVLATLALLILRLHRSTTIRPRKPAPWVI